MSLEYVDWDIGDVTVINLSGRITLGRGTQRFRQSIREVLDRGSRNILINLDEVFYIDSSGLGEMIAALKAVNREGGRLKLMKARQMARDLIQITRLYTLFEVFDQEDAAVASFRSPAAE